MGRSWAVVVMVMGLAGCAAPPAPTTPTTRETAVSGSLVEPTCDDQEGCGEGVAIGERFFSLQCLGVDPSALTDDVVAIGDGAYEEARAIEGLPPELWLAVRGDLPCRPTPDEPPEHEWYLLTSDEISPEQLQEYGPMVSNRLVAP